MKMVLHLAGCLLFFTPAANAQSTLDIECDYSHSTSNNSPSVDALSEAQWSCTETSRQLLANGLPDHPVGEFPNRHNPNAIQSQKINETLTTTPVKTDTATMLGGPRGGQGYVLNGVKIDAGTAGSCDDTGTSCSLKDPHGNWHIEALGHDSFDFGTDENNAHVQHGGSYHYHGIPENFVAQLGGGSSKMTLIAWAADGFPVYARYGYSIADDAGSPLKAMHGSYRLIENPSDSRPPADTFSLGTFQEDWEYVAGLGDLDECNGRFGVTPEFPDGIYHYYATDSYPYFQRCVMGEVEVKQRQRRGERKKRKKRQ